MKKKAASSVAKRYGLTVARRASTCSSRIWSVCERTLKLGPNSSTATEAWRCHSSDKLLLPIRQGSSRAGGLDNADEHMAGEVLADDSLLVLKVCRDLCELLFVRPKFCSLFTSYFLEEKICEMHKHQNTRNAKVPEVLQKE